MTHYFTTAENETKKIQEYSKGYKKMKKFKNEMVKYINNLIKFKILKLGKPVW